MISKAKPINLQFGHYRISARPSDDGISYASSVDELRANGTNTRNEYYYSYCSSPRMSDGPTKELKKELLVQKSDEEVDNPLEVDSDDDHGNDSGKYNHKEIGSVDEESTTSDEEYDDLVIQDVQENGYII